MNGYTGKALLVDLTSHNFQSRDIPEDWMIDYVGGEGVAVRLFWDLCKWDSDPSDPGQPIIFSTGPLTGTAAPTSGRTVIVFRSPATGTLGAANVGGHLAPAIKKAGWDLIAIVGRSENPVYLSVEDDAVKIEDASMLWGKGVWATEDTLKNDLGKKGFQIAAIGPAGEERVMFATIMTDKHRAAGRGGGGAAMGFKNLKALAVKGTKSLSVAKPEELKAAASAARREFLEEPFVKGALHPFGTPGFYDPICQLGILPTKNWQRTTYPESLPKMGYEAYHKKLDVKPEACYACPAACGRMTTVKDGPYAGSSGGGPEFETMGAFGSKCLIDDINAIAKAGHLCNDLGLDTISTGQTIATAMEWFENGILTLEKTGGLDLSWGNAAAMVEAVEKIGRREGIGDLLAEGTKRAAEKLGAGAEYAAIQVKGLELASCGVRASKGEGVSHAVSPRGGDHLRPYASTVDAFGYRDPELGITGDIDYLEDGNKEWVKPLQELSMATNLLGVCLFASITLAVKASTWASLLSAAVGREVSTADLLKGAERAINMERMVNARFGLDRKDDTLPRRVLEEPAPDGRGEGQVVNLEVALDSYYGTMGWDLVSGLPTQAKLAELGLTWTA
ncbi:MAG: aldehyde ferredoxin oxidoreductase family protein [Desulfomonilaceae bacterium]|nr:aldehyde ferredoxin oxidoreductase family protein [Desulfomonilaceae bacterium]